MPQDLPAGWSRVPPEPPPREYAPPEAYRRRALVALGVAALGVIALLVGVREAVRRIPPNAEAAAAARGDSARRARAGGATGRADRAGSHATPDEASRLR